MNPYEGVIEKHHRINELAFFPRVGTITEALFHENTSWAAILSIGYNNNSLKKGPTEIQRLFEMNVADVILYHKRVCGSCSFDGTPFLGPHCSVEHCAVTDGDMFFVTEDEAQIIHKLLSKKRSDVKQYDEGVDDYTVESLIDICK